MDSVILSPLLQRNAAKPPTSLHQLARRYMYMSSLNMKSFLPLMVLFFMYLVGCSSNPRGLGMSNYYFHPEHGLMAIDEEFVKNARNICQKQAFPDGVLVKGKKLYDRDVLAEIYFDYKFDVARKAAKKTYREKKDPFDKENREDFFQTFISEAPPYILEIREKESLFQLCLLKDQNLKRAQKPKNI